MDKKKPWRQPAKKPPKKTCLIPNQPPDVHKIEGTEISLTPDAERRYRALREARGLPEPGTDDD